MSERKYHITLCIDFDTEEAARQAERYVDKFLDLDQFFGYIDLKIINYSSAVDDFEPEDELLTDEEKDAILEEAAHPRSKPTNG